MQLQEAIRRRAMCRRFAAEPVDPSVLAAILEGALRSPTAGNTGGTAWVVLEGDETAAYWRDTMDQGWRARNREWGDGLRRAPVVLLAYASPAAYVARYAEADKADPVLGAGSQGWPVPYWHGDAAFGVMAVLLGAVDAGLGACLLGAFKGEEALAATLGVPAGWRLFGAVALGHPETPGHRSSSLRRATPTPVQRIHRGRWQA